MNPSLPYLALTLGFLSSFHCIGMCGPIALALPLQQGSRWRQFTGLLVYNSARALSYASLGAVIGIFGNAVALMGYLKYMSIAAGILLLVYVIWPGIFAGFFSTPMWLGGMVGQIKNRMSRQLRSKKMYGWFMLGLLNGLLPCGLVYLALMSSIATGSMTGGAIFMFVFGMGTLPAMMAVGFFKNWITPLIRSRFHRITPLFIAFAGIWLLYRSTLIHPGKHPTGADSITVCHGK